VSTETLSVHILGKDYQVACPSDEREALLDAALELDRRMKSIRQTGSVIGVERIAVMAALNLAHEVISSPKVDDSQEELLASIHQRIDAVLPS
jgi:cell division protein ZapA